ncbi:energy transducer TonB [Pseudodesulfovibrio sediminis]|uniref:TonB C-terminal domain-containing protein n=1 Tax=Pseudodesulfovibrio sediminis TaxID=2810563 RepID=A0ABN6EP06_9BACT|nr:energy transducer TonB [Pseudodesulfovibrio sediminis]BCS88081.1 hypothetical protein PSDVSF_13230 [Pseudodesulfovibrio sediminis]
MTLWKVPTAFLGAVGITIAFCLLIPMLGTNRDAPLRLEENPVPVVIVPPEVKQRIASGGGTTASVAPVHSPSIPGLPLPVPTLPATGDVPLPALSGPSGLSLAAPAAPTGGMFEPGAPAFDKPPQVLTRLDPYYPPAARRTGTEGQVLIRVLVDENGRVESADVIRSEPAGVFDAAAIKAVRGWRFSPAQRAGQPVAVRIDIPISFRLD